jgi:hypothetical protein
LEADVLVNAHNWLSPVSPDGRVVAVKSPGGLLLVPLDGGPIQSLKGSGANEVGVEWSPDARDLFAYEPGVIPARIVRVEVATGRRTPWKELRPPEVSAPGVGAVVMTRDGRLGAYGYSTSSVDLYLVTGVR